MPSICRTARSLPVPFLAALVGAALVACADAPGSSSTGPGGEVWQATADLRIGSLDDSVYALTRPSRLLVADDGTMYSVHPSESRVRIWSADGTAAGSVGGPGEGPGEFQRPSALGLAGDTLWVFDTRQYRTSRFDAEGRLLGTESPRIAEGEGPSLRPARPLGDGTYLGTPVVASHLVATGEIESAPWVRLTREGEILDTIFVQSYGTHTQIALLRDGGGTFTSQPFSDRALVTADPIGGGLLVVLRRAAAEEPRRGRVEVLRLAADGDTTWSRQIRFDAEPVTQEQADSAVDAIAGRLHEWIGERTGQSLSAFRRDVDEALYHPPHHPVVTSARVGRDGTVWLALRASPEAPEDGRLWKVLAPDGTDLATITLPRDLSVLAADADHVWGVVTDELDVPYIVRYTVESSI